MKEIVDICIKVFSLPIQVMGYSITLWQLFVFSTLCCILLGAVFKLFNGE